MPTEFSQRMVSLVFMTILLSPWIDRDDNEANLSRCQYELPDGKKEMYCCLFLVIKNDKATFERFFHLKKG
jgi:hypothetical protein